MNWKKGMKIKCINGNFFNRSTDPFKVNEIDTPEKGKSYTIREVVDTTLYGLGLRLKEIRNKEFFFQNISKYEEPIFSTDRFELLGEKG